MRARTGQQHMAGGLVAAVELRTLGECQIVIGKTQLGPQSPNAFALALYLCVERGHPHARDQLLPMFFPGGEVPKAAHSLRQNLYKLRTLGLPCVGGQSGTMVPAASVRDDYSALLATGELPDPSVAALPKAFLPGYWPDISDAFTAWLERHRDAVNGALRRAYVARIIDRRAVARWDQVEAYARACLEVDPLNEEATLALAEALALSGSKAAGVKVLDDFIAEVGAGGPSLAIPASTLRRRISERLRDHRRDWVGQLVGREAEIRVFNELLGSALAGRSSSMWISGEPGIGKTRLLHEFTCLAQLAGVRVASAVCQPHDLRLPFSVLSDVVPSLIKLPGAIGCSPEALGLINRYTSRGDTEHTHGTAPSKPLPFGSTSSWLSRGLSELLDAISVETSVALVIDDAQWLDPLSMQVLSDLVAERKDRRTLILVGSREPCALQALDSAHVRKISMSGLLAEPAARYVAEAAATFGRALSPTVITHAVTLAGGNPLFLRYLAEHYVADPDPAALPVKLRDAIDHRIKGLSHSAVTVVCACALLGRYASLAHLTAVLQMPTYKLALELGRLEEQRLIASDGDRLLPAHTLITDAAISAYPSSALSLLCRCTAEVLESSARLTSDQALFWTARERWEESGDRGRAAACMRQCARLAASVGILDATIRSSDDVLTEPASTITARICESLDVPRSASELTEEIARIVREHSGRPDEMSLRTLLRDEAQPLAARLRAGTILMSTAEFNADPQLAHIVFEEGRPARASARTNDPDAVRVTLAYHAVFGDQERSIDLARTCAAVRCSSHEVDGWIRNAINGAEALAKCGVVEDSLQLSESAFRQADGTGNFALADAVSLRAAWNARQLGDVGSLSSWRLRYRRIAGRPQSDAYSGYLYNEALAAFDELRLNDAERNLGELEARMPPDCSIYHRALVDALRLRKMAEDPSRIVDSDILELLKEWSLRTAPLIPQDDVAHSVYLAQERVKPADAPTFLREYLRVRRTSTFAVLGQLCRWRSAFG